MASRVPTSELELSSSANHGCEMHKVVLCGCSGVGKTSIYLRLKDNTFYGEVPQTVKVDQCSVPLQCLCNIKIKLHLWDTLGMEKFAALTRTHYHNSRVVLIVYSIDVQDSIAQVLKCIEEAKVGAPGALHVLVSNKTDLDDFHKLENELGVKELFPKKDYKYHFRISAKTGDGVEELRKFLCKYIHKASKHASMHLGTDIEKSNGNGQNISLERQNSQCRGRRLKCCARQ